MELALFAESLAKSFIRSKNLHHRVKKTCCQREREKEREREIERERERKRKREREIERTAAVLIRRCGSTWIGQKFNK
jgi:hypothetical protein